MATNNFKERYKIEKSPADIKSIRSLNVDSPELKKNISSYLAKDIQAYNTMYIACYLYILDKEGSLLYGNRKLTDKKDEVPIPVLYSRDHTT